MEEETAVVEAADEQTPVQKIMMFVDGVKTGQPYVGHEGAEGVRPYGDGYYAVAEASQAAFGSGIRHRSRVYPKFDAEGNPLSGVELLKRRLGRMYAEVKKNPTDFRGKIEATERQVLSLRKMADEAMALSNQLAGSGLDSFLIDNSDDGPDDDTDD